MVVNSLWKESWRSDCVPLHLPEAFHMRFLFLTVCSRKVFSYQHHIISHVHSQCHSFPLPLLLVWVKSSLKQSNINISFTGSDEVILLFFSPLSSNLLGFFLFIISFTSDCLLNNTTVILSNTQVWITSWILRKGKVEICSDLFFLWVMLAVLSAETRPFPWLNLLPVCWYGLAQIHSPVTVSLFSTNAACWWTLQMDSLGLQIALLEN